MAKGKEGFWKQNTVEIKHEGKIIRCFALEADKVRAGLEKRSRIAKELKAKQKGLQNSKQA